ncbi:sugar ABC transporter substrate-binding protein [Geodermatophilus sp. CPCC 205506]|uniref:sugar ABC transporter substrate-binding protein n=1 Tax=Geodermatophilus sp. CPCC 205506 TaxID=2936596 RepID=UPI003EEB3CA2
MISRKLAAAGAAVAATSLLLAGCGSSSDASSPGAAASSDSKLQETARAKVAEFEAGPETYPGPTEAFDPGTGRAEVIGCGFAAPVCAEQSGYAVDALQAMGWQTGPPVDGEFSPQVWSSFVDRAVQDDLDGIIIVSIDVGTIKASVDRALAAELPIVCVMCTPTEGYADEVLYVTTDWANQGEIAAWQVMADAGDQASVVTFFDRAFQSSVLRAQGLEQTLKEHCPGCTYEAVDFPSSSNGKPGPPEYTAFLASHPEGTVTHAIGHFDGMALALSRTNVQSGRDDILVSGYDGSPEFVAALVSQNPPVHSTVAEAYTYASWSGADLLGRVAAGVPVWEGYDNLPNTLITESNAESFLGGNPSPSTFPAPEGDWQSEFRKLWGKS